MLRIRDFCALFLRRFRRPRSRIDWGQFRTISPVSRQFGLDRGTPIDRFYINHFMESVSHNIQGKVLEVAEDRYAMRYGRGVRRLDILHVDEHAPQATVCGDFRTGNGLEGLQFDCIIATQTLQFIDDPLAAVRTIHNVLSPGGCFIGSFTLISPISIYDADRWGEFWRPTSLACRRLLESAFDAKGVHVVGFGNALAATAAIQGIAAEELERAELTHTDRQFEVVTAFIAIK